MSYREEKFDIEFDMCGDTYIGIGTFSRFSELRIGTVDEYGRCEMISVGGIEDVKFEVLERLTDDAPISILGNEQLVKTAEELIANIYQ